MLAALCFVAGAPIAPPGANVPAAEPPPPAAANVSALVAASAAGDAVNSAALLQEVLAEAQKVRAYDVCAKSRGCRVDTSCV